MEREQQEKALPVGPKLPRVLPMLFAAEESGQENLIVCLTGQERVLEGKPDSEQDCACD